MSGEPTRSNHPQWPQKMSRADRTEAKERQKAFESALKSAAKNSSWCYARKTLFRDDEGWFLSNCACLAYERGVFVEWARKPMPLDALFWQIAGLEENTKLPLSFRATGAWTLQPPRKFEYVSGDEESPIELASVALDWSERRRESDRGNATIEKLIAELGPPEALIGQNCSLAICLYILKSDFDAAERLCLDDGLGPHAFGKNSGGFISMLPDGNSITFVDQAREWLLRRKRAFI